MTRAEAIGVLCNYKIVGMRSGKTQLIQAIYIALATLREQEQREQGCEYCREDREGFYRAIGSFFLSNPFHKGEYFLNGGKLKPRKIEFCPMCGKRLEV